MPPDAPSIGIISGMGPYAGLDLAAKIHRHTDARTDQEHLPVVLISHPHRLPDRSTFLFDPTRPSPVPPLVDVAERLEAAGATVAGMPCNTAHGPAIFEAMREKLRAAGRSIRLVHMIEETARHLRARRPSLERVGILSTLAVYRLNLYTDVLEAAGFTTVRPDEEMQLQVVNPVIFDTTYGIKAKSAPVTERARQDLLRAIEALRERGAEAVILGCTELPLALPEPDVNGLPLIDPTTVLAHALIRETYPGKLREKERGNREEGL